MRRSTRFFGSFSLLKAGVAGALILATTLSCSETTAPIANRDPALDGITVLEMHVPASLKHDAQSVSSSGAISAARIANDMTSVSNAAVPPAGVTRASVAAASYTVSSVGFTPQPAPANFLAHCDDCIAYSTPIGFDFTYFGNSYNKVHVGANGFAAFDSIPAEGLGGCCEGGVIPSPVSPLDPDNAPYNNMISVFWTDLNSAARNADIRYETQGVAPNRKFVVQWNSVPEYFNGPGRVTAQLVLSEGSNDITINTFSATLTTAPYHPVTQGIENADGTEAEFVPGRVQSYFALTNDAVRFSIARPVLPPVVVPPPDIEVPTAGPAASSRFTSISPSVGTCDAVVNPGVATVNGDASGVTITGARNDGLSLDAAYPKGTTTITWTATNPAGSASASQKVIVEDKEKPVVTAPANVSSGNAPGLASASVAVGTASAVDNCHEVTVDGARNDGAALSAPYNVGVTSIIWTARDASGNTSAATQSITVLDVEAPTISVPADLLVNATSPDGAAAIFTVSGHDNVLVTSISCSPASGTMFPMGPTTVSCTASDAAGNKASSSFVVTVVGAEAQLGDLIAYVRSRDLPNGITNPLVNQLLAAFRTDNSHVSCIKMGDFINMVAKDGDAIRPDWSAYMTSEATQIMDVMGCSAESRRPALPSRSIKPGLQSTS